MSKKELGSLSIYLLGWIMVNDLIAPFIIGNFLTSWDFWQGCVGAILIYNAKKWSGEYIKNKEK